jgi:hypothetical protein
MTKIRHLAFHYLQTKANNENAPISQADHSLKPDTAPPALPTTLTNEELQMFINKAQDILLHRHSSNTLAIDHLDLLPNYDMFPEHGGIFMHKSLNKRLHELSADQITLSPEKLKPSGNLNRSSFYTSDKSSNDKTELIHEIPAQDAILNIPLGLLSLDLNYK